VEDMLCCAGTHCIMPWVMLLLLLLLPGVHPALQAVDPCYRITATTTASGADLLVLHVVTVLHFHGQ